MSASMSSERENQMNYLNLQVQTAGLNVGRFVGNGVLVGCLEPPAEYDIR